MATPKKLFWDIFVYKAFLYSMYSLILALSDNYSFGGGGDGPNNNNPTTVLVMLLFGFGVIVGL